jgi:glycosyltransferase involved in cell wall biosynthesis
MSRVMLVLEATDGGTARHVVDLALGSYRRGFDTHLVCATRRAPEFRHTLSQLREAGITVHEFDMRREVHPLRDLAAMARLRRLILGTAPDVLHLHSSKAGALGRGALVGLGRRRPVVVYTPHAYAFLAQPGSLHRWAYRRVESALLPWTDGVVAVSESEGQAACRLGAKDRVVVIRNGVEAGASPARQSGERPGLRIGWLGRLAWQKNPEAAVKTSLALSRLGLNHELLLAGDGPDRERVLAAIRELRVEASVRVLGYVRDTNAFLAGINVFLMTSRTEGLPYAGLDAMAHGLPIVGFDAPGVRDLVESGVTGLLAAPDDVGELAAHVARLERDEGLRRSFGVAAQRRVRHNFRLQEQLDQLSRLYCSLASGRAAAGIGVREDIVRRCFNFSFTE